MSGNRLIEAEVEMVHYRGERLVELLRAKDLVELRQGWWGESLAELEEAHAAFEQFPPRAWWRTPR